MKTLELFSGTQSFSKGMKRTFPETDCVTVDILSKFLPSHRVDILLWDYKIYPPHHFQIIWASPPCDQYSSAKTRGERDLVKADSYVLKCFEIIDYFKPLVWLMENPATGLLPKRIETLRPNIQKPSICDYCAYGKPYRKRTAIWSNISFDLLTCNKDCPSKKDGRHVGIIGGTGVKGQKQIRNIWQRDEIPSSLIDSIIFQLVL
jgi:site-specific DNA-cytosine methylase